jgi:hypothetical protein
MNDPTSDTTLVERWLTDQQHWQRTLFNYLDSMMKNDEFLMHMGNAMRGSLLAGKPYPTATAPTAPAEEAPSTERLDKVLFALHQLQGQVQDVLMTLDEMRGTRKKSAGAAARKAVGPKPATRTSAKSRVRVKADTTRTGKRRTRR